MSYIVKTYLISELYKYKMATTETRSNRKISIFFYIITLERGYWSLWLDIYTSNSISVLNIIYHIRDLHKSKMAATEWVKSKNINNVSWYNYTRKIIFTVVIFLNLKWPPLKLEYIFLYIHTRKMILSSTQMYIKNHNCVEIYFSMFLGFPDQIWLPFWHFEKYT